MKPAKLECKFQEWLESIGDDLNIHYTAPQLAYMLIKYGSAICAETYDGKGDWRDTLRNIIEEFIHEAD